MKTKKNKESHRLEGCFTDPRNKRMKETNRRQRRIEASSEGGQSPEGAVAPHMYGFIFWLKKFVLQKFCLVSAKLKRKRKCSTAVMLLLCILKYL